jgi:hypothetical protein
MVTAQSEAWNRISGSRFYDNAGHPGARGVRREQGRHPDSEGAQTVSSRLLADQPALHGLLAKIRDLGLCLISVRRLDGAETGNRLQPSGTSLPGTS